MQWRPLIGLVFTVVAVAVGCGKSTPAADVGAPRPVAAAPSAPAGKPQPRLPTVKLWLGPKEIVAEVARSIPQLQAGMMWRTNLAENEGMLFVFPVPQRASFWMRNTLLPLDGAYIDGEGTILEVHAMNPLEERPVEAKSDRIQFVLEMNRGWFEKNKLGPGTVIRTEFGSLAETFFGRK